MTRGTELSGRTRSRRQSPAVALRTAAAALKLWTPRQFAVAAVASVAVGLLIGVASVLIPNPFFARDIPPVWWNYPVWLVTSVLSGMLTATYVRQDVGQPAGREQAVPEQGSQEQAEEERTSRIGLAGGLLAWFAVGCPVCNKIAVLALGYTGAATWFAGFQPVLAVLALVLTGWALVARLCGQLSCPVAEVPATVAR